MTDHHHHHHADDDRRGMAVLDAWVGTHAAELRNVRQFGRWNYWEQVRDDRDDLLAPGGRW